MIRKRTLVAAGAMLALGTSLQGAISVGYFTDGLDSNGVSHVSNIGPSVPIAANGFTAIQITDITTFNLSTIQILLIDEINNGSPTAALLSQATALSNWVAGGGVIGIHDRNVCLGTCTPVPGSAGIIFTHVINNTQGQNIDVETPGTLVTNGPFGIIDNTTLDGGTFSDNGSATIPSSALGILNNGSPGNEVAFSYRFGSGWVYYATIPLDFYLDSTIPAFARVPAAFRTIYAPNMVAYLGCLASGACSPAVVTSTAAAGAPTLSEWGLAILAILLMGCAALMLRSGQAKGPTDIRPPVKP